MDKTTLVKDDIAEGEELIKHLDTTGFKVNSALWFYDPYLEEWRLILASKYLDKNGLKKAYDYVQKELNKIELHNIELNNIAIVKSDDELVKLLRPIITTKRNQISGMRLSRMAISGTMIEDVYVYRIT